MSYLETIQNAFESNVRYMFCIYNAISRLFNLYLIELEMWLEN